MARALQTELTESGRGTTGIELPWRVLSLLNVFRLLLPMLLLLVFFFNAPSNSVGAQQPGLFMSVAVGYFAFGLVCIQTIQSRIPSAEWQAILQLLVDAVAMSMLIHASGGVSSGLATLLVLPTGAAATILQRRYALLGTSFVALSLLVETTISFLQGESFRADFLITGLTGASLFAITLLAVPFAARLRESEALAKQREIDLASLNELNEFIVQHLRESILVVDANDQVRLINETAAQLLRGGAVPSGSSLAAVSPRLSYVLEAWRRQASDRRDNVGEIVGADGGTVIRPHFVALGESGFGPVLIFLEDTSAIADRAQQSKLAALGRLSASIAHEIRNPVGAMSHAGQLLRESPGLTADDRHLTDIIEKNGVRVSHIIENVLQLSRRETTRQERLDVTEWLSGFIAEYEQTLQLDHTSSRIDMDRNVGRIDVQFDPSHLHQVLWNLCDNAFRHGAGPGATGRVDIRAGRIAATGRPFVEVADRGNGVDPSQAERIFEPFFTTGSGGTGLGLFISRELCQTNGALLLYEPRPGGGSIFRIIFADPSRWKD
ncbi:MAG: ATP-binding protein [Gammaproteobacteria bacterium]|nr:ATP-binding protein [Gammaproteobacteria bacterium]MDH4311300.1 ATP-binding protein [Gammaproteobacteria bacterium]